MKHLYYIIVLTGILLSSCIDQDAQQEVSAIKIRLSMPDEFNDTIQYANQVVTLKNNRFTYKAQTDTSGTVVFSGIVPGIYNMSTSDEFSEGIIIAGDSANIVLFDNADLNVRLKKIIKQSLIISKVYGSGTKDNNNKNYIADKYIEIFNNSDAIQYLDGTTYLGLVEAESVIAYPAASNPDYVYARQVFRFPTEGIAVAPGAKVVIANSAINHTLYSPNSVNLQTADLEAKNTTYSNNPAVKPIELIFTTFSSITYMNLVNGGDNGVFLFKTTDDVKNFPAFYIPGKESGNRYMRIPMNTILDAVEILKNYAATGPRPEAKRLQSIIDATFTNINATTGYTHEITERRVDKSKSTATRYYLIDTNNSQNDFRVTTDPTPGIYNKDLLMLK